MRALRSPLTALALGLLVLAQAAGSEWPTDRGDNARTGASSEILTLPLQRTWTIEAPAAPRLAWSSAEGRVIEGKLIGHRIRFDDAFRTVVSNGCVYYGSTVDHQVHCVDLASGREEWTFFTGGPVRLAPTVSGDDLLFGSDDGLVYCLDKATGALKWQQHAAPSDEWLLARGEMISKWPVRTGVLVHQGTAYFGSGIFPHEDVYLKGADLQSGRIVWSVENISAQDAGRNDLSPQGYLLAKDNLLVVPSGGSLPAVFDLTTGGLLHKRTHSWRTTAGGVVGGTRVVLADGQLYASGPHHFLAMDEVTGDVGFAWVEGRQLCVQGDQAYVATGTRVARLDRLKYAEASRQRHQLELEIYELSRIRDPESRERARERVVAAAEELKLLEPVGVDWQAETSDDLSLLVTGEHVFVGGPGRVTAYRKDNGEQVWSAEVEGESRGLAVADGRLLVSTDAGIIACFATAPAPGAADVGLPSSAAAAGSFAADPLLAQAAEEILARTGVTRGYCLVLGSDEGQLARELALRSELRIYCVEPDAAKVQRSRELLAAAGLYGHRVAVHQRGFDAIPYSNFFANLIVSETTIRTGELPQDVAGIARCLKPVGGVLCLGRPSDAEPVPAAELQRVLRHSGLEDQSELAVFDGWGMLTRGRLPGTGDWTHQYGGPANTAVSADRRISGDLGVLWYGDPGPGDMVNRHEGAVGPLAMNGTLFVQGETTIKAYDAYNGVHLWTHENPAALRTGVFQNQNPGNLAAGEGCLFYFVGQQCLQLDAQTGQVVATHHLPPGLDQGTHQWGYVAIENGMLYGTATVRQELEQQARRRGRVTADATDAIFALDIASGQHAWSYQGKSISHHTIAIAPDKVCFIDSSITSEQREELLRQDKSALASLTGEARAIAEDRLKNADVRMAVALDARTGQTLWAHPVDVTDCSEIGTGGGKLTMMYAEGKLLLCGANANGHYWQQFISGEFQRRRLVVLSAEDGYTLWAKDANYRHRPIIIGQQILAEPWMFDLETGDQIMRPHPVTGQPVPWSIMRTGHHCGMLTACDSGMLLFRSGATGFADLNADEGIRHFGGHRLGCWINAIAAEGLVLIPEASAGCVCQFSIASTIVLEPREPRRPWTIYSAVGSLTPVEHLAVNLGAPGDRKDAHGRVWFSYPRSLAYKETSLDVKLEVRPEFAQGGGFESIGPRSGSADSRPTLTEAQPPWIYDSWANNLRRMTIPVLGPDDAPAQYLVRLHFADLRQNPASTSMTVRLQAADADREVEVDLPAPNGSPIIPTVIEVPGVRVHDTLAIELIGRSGTPLLNAVEIVREKSAVRP